MLHIAEMPEEAIFIDETIFPSDSSRDESWDSLISNPSPVQEKEKVEINDNLKFTGIKGMSHNFGKGVSNILPWSCYFILFLY